MNNKVLRYAMLALITWCFTGLISFSHALSSPSIALYEQGKQHYEAGQLTAAIELWQQAEVEFIQQGDTHHHLLSCKNLAIAYQDLGQWQQAEAEIAEALAVLSQADNPFLRAQILNTQGSLQFNSGKSEAALATWQQAETLYRALEDTTGIALSQMNQAQAMQTLGLYRQARRVLEQVNQDLESSPDSLLKARSFRNLGVNLQMSGDLTQAQESLQKSLAIAQQLHSPAAASETLLRLGNLARTREDLNTALALYTQAQTQATLPQTQISAALNRLSVLVKLQNPQEAIALIPPIQTLLATQPASRWSIYAQVNLAAIIAPLPSPTDGVGTGALPLLVRAVRQARQIHDSRAESYALGQLGQLYEQTQQWTEALDLTQQALRLAEGIAAEEIAVTWEWQRGRILQAQGKTETAIAAYEQAVHMLAALRQDLVAMNPDVQFSFRDQVAPVYRQFVGLLLQDVDQLPGAEQQARLKQSREAIAALQLAELQNFFRETCQTYRPQAIDDIDPEAAVIYPIVLEQRLEVILSLPGQPLQHYGSALTAAASTQWVNELRQSLNPAFPATTGLAAAQRLYDLLLRPAEAALAQQQIQTLVFAPDDFLWNLPLAALHDGKQYLIEKYSLALTPGLELFQTSLLASARVRPGQVVVGGVTTAHQGFEALPGVEREIAAIADQTQAKMLLNQAFTQSHLQDELGMGTSSIVHLATHGQFSSRAEETFVLTWNGRLGVKEFGQRLRQRGDRHPIDLLVLSACQTAKGDDRATLGLAGIAVRSGARSTLATLWSVQDQSTADLMTVFYTALTQPGTTKAKALQQAQLALLGTDTEQAQYRHPYYWAAFVLIGNWR